MAQKDIKNLTVAELKKQDKVLDKQREFTVEVGGQKYKLSHDIVFRKSKQSQVLNDLVKFFTEAMKDVELLQLATPYATLLVFKYFTTLEVSDEIDEAIALLTILVDLGLFNAILLELPEEQLKETFELITNTVNDMREQMEEMDKIADEVENPEVKEMIGHGE